MLQEREEDIERLIHLTLHPIVDMHHERIHHVLKVGVAFKVGVASFKGAAFVLQYLLAVHVPKEGLVEVLVKGGRKDGDGWGAGAE